jgi:hypothetical protein
MVPKARFVWSELMSRMPRMYKLPLGLPFHWAHEVSGHLESAVKAYLDNRIDNATIRDDQIDLLREYFVHYINAPCWDNPEFESELLDLRTSAKELDSAAEIGAWIAKCMDIGLDPL